MYITPSSPHHFLPSNSFGSNQPVICTGSSSTPQVLWLLAFLCGLCKPGIKPGNDDPANPGCARRRDYSPSSDTSELYVNNINSKRKAFTYLNSFLSPIPRKIPGEKNSEHSSLAVLPFKDSTQPQHDNS